MIKQTRLVFLSQTHLTSGSSVTVGRNTTKLMVELVGGGGGGGGTTGSASNTAVGAGGGAGCYSMKLFDVTPNTSYSYTRGAAGAAGTSSGGNGGAGGQSSFTVGGTTVTAPGGAGGLGMLTGSALLINQGALGGVAGSNADLTIPGEPGGDAMRLTTVISLAGHGGSCRFGSGGRNNTVSGTTGAVGGAGSGNGSGGGGGRSGGNTARAGGAGAIGSILITEYAVLIG